MTALSCSAKSVAVMSHWNDCDSLPGQLPHDDGMDDVSRKVGKADYTSDMSIKKIFVSLKQTIKNITQLSDFIFCLWLWVALPN